MDDNPKKATIQIRGMLALKAETIESIFEEETTEYILGRGGADVVATAMRLHPGNLEVQLAGLDCILQWTSHAGKCFRSLVVFIPTIIRVMKFQNHPLILQKACAVLFELTSSFGSCFRIQALDSGGVETVTYVLKTNTSVAGIHVEGVNALLALLYGDGVCQFQGVETKVFLEQMDVLLGLVKQQINNERFCNRVFSVLLAFHNRCKLLKDTMLGWVDTVVKALRVHCESGNTATIICQLLAAVTQGDRATQDATSARGGADTILQVMRRNTGCHVLQTACVSVISDIVGGNAAAADAFIRMGYVGDVLGAMRWTPGFQLQRTGLKTICSLLSSNRLVMPTLKAACSMAAVSAMRKFPLDVTVTEYGCSIFTDCGSTSKEVLPDVIGVILQALCLPRTTTTNAKIDVLFHLFRLYPVAVANEIARRDGAVELVAKSMGSLDFFGQQKSGLCLKMVATALLDEKRSSAHIRHSAMILAFALDKMRAYPNNVELQISGVWILARLMSTKSSTIPALVSASREFVNAAGMNTMLSTLRRYRYNNELNYAASIVMRAIVEYAHKSDGQGGGMNDID